MKNQKIKTVRDVFHSGKVAAKGDVLEVGKDISEPDAKTLVTMKKAVIVVEERKKETETDNSHEPESDDNETATSNGPVESRAEQLEGMKAGDLKELAKDLKGFKKNMKKEELIELILESES